MVTYRIGKAALPATAIFRDHGLTPFRQILSPSLFQNAFPVTPEPKTILIPEVVFWLMGCAALAEQSMAGAVTAFWASLRAVVPRLPLQAVTEEAFVKARWKVPLRFFLRLFALVVSRFTMQYADAYRWKGFRLLGLDGMDVELPADPHVKRIYPPPTNQHGLRGRPQARLVGRVGLADGVCYDFRWTSLAVSEQASAESLARRLEPADLLLADRNFADLARMAAVRSRGAHFLFHLPSNRFLKRPRTATPSGRNEEWYVTLDLPEALRQRYPQLGPTLPVRILQYQRPGYRASWLITSLLDTADYPYEEVVELYHRRWFQETFHREWKHTLQLNNLRSHSAQGLLKEVLVQLTLNNVIRWIMAQAAPPPLLPVQLKFLEAKRLILASVPAMTAAPAFLLPELYRHLLRVIGRQRILVRPGRSYPRQWDARDRPKGHGKVAAPARLVQPKENRHAPS